MKVKLIGDGTSMNTHVVNADTGEDIANIVRLEYVIETRPTMASFNDFHATITLTIDHVPVEVTGDAEIQD